MTFAACTRVVVAACSLAIAVPVFAQDPHAGHGQPAKPAPAKPQPAKPQPQAAKPQPANEPPASKPADAPAMKEMPATGAEDHSAHGAAPPPAATATPGSEAAQQPKEPIPPITDADRAAAFPPGLQGHAVHDRAINYMFLFDQLEWQGNADGGLNLDALNWIGGDRNRLWIRSELESERSRVENAFVDVLYGRAIARWWDVVAGVRQDFGVGPGRTWVGGGIQGVAPYWFEVEATAYVGEGGRTHARFEIEYELLLTNRLILQPLLESEFYGKSDPERALGAGLSTIETGLRMRYEFKREFGPYVGITWNRKMFGTADFARAEGERVGAARLAFGLRTWF
ncbi:MAG TPA: copper resistance protein B [Vicinamibacterales bacterium]|nr:copper resistance protein B [Vicinamibacterales bacterium]